MSRVHSQDRAHLAVWQWLDDHLAFIPIAHRMRFAFWVGRVRTRWQWRERRALHRWERFTLLVRVRPMWVAFHGYCCDTGPFTWSHRFQWQGWRWPGLLACQATTPDALYGASDGPTDYSVMDEPVLARTCQGCGAGNAPFSSTGFDLCQSCQYHEVNADVDF